MYDNELTIITLGEQLKEARKKLNYTQQQVADMVQLPRPIYARFELNDFLPNYDDFAKICEILNLPGDTKHYTLCIQCKIACIHAKRHQGSINTYKLSVRLNTRDFAQLTKSNLRKAGFENLRSFISVAYEELCRRLQSLEK